MKTRHKATDHVPENQAMRWITIYGDDGSMTKKNAVVDSRNGGGP